MDIQASAKYVRVTPRKLQLLADSVRALTPQKAVTALSFMHESGARELKQVLASALANAKNKNAAVESNLVIKSINVLPGSAMKRFRAVSRGMAHEYKKRMSHVKVVLGVVEKSQKLSETQNVKIKNQNAK